MRKPAKPDTAALMRANVHRRHRKARKEAERLFDRAIRFGQTLLRYGEHLAGSCWACKRQGRRWTARQWRWVVVDRVGSCVFTDPLCVRCCRALEDKAAAWAAEQVKEDERDAQANP